MPKLFPGFENERPIRIEDRAGGGLPGLEAAQLKGRPMALSPLASGLGGGLGQPIGRSGRQDVDVLGTARALNQKWAQQGKRHFCDPTLAFSAPA